MPALTISMQRIADLADVQRPLVTMWRKRHSGGSDAPFPEPLLPVESAAARDTQLKFDAIEVAKWLVETDHGNNSDAVADAPFYSDLFNEAVEDPRVWAALVAHARGGEEVTPETVRDELFSESLVPSEILEGDLEHAVTSANILAEAAFSATKVLVEIIRRRRSQTPEALVENAEALLAAIGSELIKELHRDKETREVLAFGPGGGAWAQHAIESHESPLGIGFEHDDFTPELCLSLARGIEVLEVTDEWDPSAVAFLQWASAKQDDAQELFDQIGYVQSGLDARGCVVVIAPAELLIESSNAVVNLERRNFLWGSKNNLHSSLRYAALFPHGWTRSLGQSQLALWILRTRDPEKFDSDLVILADYSSLDFSGTRPRQFVMDVLAAVNDEVSPRQHAFYNSLVLTDENLRMRNSLRPIRERVSEKEEIATIAELRLQADAVGVDLSRVPNLQQAGNPYEIHRRKLLSWTEATKQPAPLVKVIKGSKLQDLDTGNPDGTIPVIGRSELSGLAPAGARKANIVDISVKLPRSTLTEPGDVVWIYLNKPVAIVDAQGGSLVEAPAQILRCMKTRARSKTPLEEVTSPYLLAEQLGHAQTKDKKAWQVPVIEQRDAEVFEAVMREVDARRAELLEQLEGISAFRRDFGVSLASGGIRAAPE
ncbi:DNA-binding protein [Corynebacterium amycolatum]|uniref:DNA-binding protein n=2 Tax=Corynebacterium TaxID=1716 RepID=A0A7T4G6U0_CORAY|nr:DNA-binding protein [Corynebacterium amycolatum]QQB83312.1 DNA-binding protein [Corynebacterium amycolatum]